MVSESEIINLSHVSVIRRGRATLDDVSFSAREGEHWAVIGPNGAGKSTLMALCAAVTYASRGVVSILGQRVGTVDRGELTKHIGYVTTHHLLEWPMTATDVLLTAFTNTVETPMRWTATHQQRAAARQQLEKFGLVKVAETNWRALSQGELGRLFLARATLLTPRIILLDEPASGLDLAAREQVLDVIDELVADNPALTSVSITHHVEELPSSTSHVALMAHAKILFQGPISDTLTSENVSTTFGLPIRVVHDDGRWSTRSERSSRT
jgi:iron complex transport system ATP-binding protein